MTTVVATEGWAPPRSAGSRGTTAHLSARGAGSGSTSSTRSKGTLTTNDWLPQHPLSPTGNRTALVIEPIFRQPQGASVPPQNLSDFFRLVHNGAGALDNAIEAASPSNWSQQEEDEECAHPYSAETWGRAARFLRHQDRYARFTFGESLPVPLISRAQEASLDLYWETDGRKLLINFPAEAELSATYYGEDASGNTTAGEIPPKAEHAYQLAQWLTQRP